MKGSVTISFRGRVPCRKALTAWDLQDWAEAAGPSRRIGRYQEADQQRMAVLDYVTGNTDRHAGNWLTGRDGRPVAIDNGLSFPTNAADKLRSDFIARWLNLPLDDAVTAPLRALDIHAMEVTLRGVGLSESAIEGTMARVAEISENGRITGEAWQGRIADARWRTVK